MITADNIDGQMPPISSCKTLQGRSAIHHPNNQTIALNPMPYCKESVYEWIYNAQTMQNIANNRKTLTIP